MSDVACCPKCGRCLSEYNRSSMLGRPNGSGKCSKHGVVAAYVVGSKLGAQPQWDEAA